MNKTSLEEVERSILSTVDPNNIANYLTMKNIKFLSYKSKSLPEKNQDWSKYSYSTNTKRMAHLRDELNNMGYNFPNSREGEKKAYKEALKLWWDIMEQKQPIDDIPVTKLDYLPSTDVKIGDKNYHIHGIVHGFIGVKKPVKDFIRQNVIDYDTRKNSKVFVESGFKKLFDLNHYGKDFDDLDLVKARDLPRLLSSVVAYPVASVLIKLSKKGRIISKNLKWPMKNINSLPRAKEICHRMHLPEPLTMEYFSDDEFNNRYITKRSQKMATKMVRNAEDDVEDVHAVVGLFHEPQIEYYLKIIENQRKNQVVLA